MDVVPPTSATNSLEHSEKVCYGNGLPPHDMVSGESGANSSGNSATPPTILDNDLSVSPPSSGELKPALGIPGFVSTASSHPPSSDLEHSVAGSFNLTVTGSFHPSFSFGPPASTASTPQAPPPGYFSAADSPAFSPMPASTAGPPPTRPSPSPPAPPTRDGVDAVFEAQVDDLVGAAAEGRGENESSVHFVDSSPTAEAPFPGAIAPAAGDASPASAIPYSQINSVSHGAPVFMDQTGVVSYNFDGNVSHPRVPFDATSVPHPDFPQHQPQQLVKVSSCQQLHNGFHHNVLPFAASDFGVVEGGEAGGVFAAGFPAINLPLNNSAPANGASVEVANVGESRPTISAAFTTVKTEFPVSGVKEPTGSPLGVAQPLVNPGENQGSPVVDPALSSPPGGGPPGVQYSNGKVAKWLNVNSPHFDLPPSPSGNLENEEAGANPAANEELQQQQNIQDSGLGGPSLLTPTGKQKKIAGQPVPGRPDMIMGEDGKPRPKKYQNSYMLFCKEERLNVAKDFPEATPIEVARILGQRWRDLAADLKRPYQERAKRDKDEWVAKYGDYKSLPGIPKKKRPSTKKTVSSGAPVLMNDGMMACGGGSGTNPGSHVFTAAPPEHVLQNSQSPQLANDPWNNGTVGHANGVASGTQPPSDPNGIVYGADGFPPPGAHTFEPNGVPRSPGRALTPSTADKLSQFQLSFPGGVPGVAAANLHPHSNSPSSGMTPFAAAFSPPDAAAAYPIVPNSSLSYQNYPPPPYTNNNHGQNSPAWGQGGNQMGIVLHHQQTIEPGARNSSNRSTPIPTLGKPVIMETPPTMTQPTEGVVAAEVPVASPSSTPQDQLHHHHLGMQQHQIPGAAPVAASYSLPPLATAASLIANSASPYPSTGQPLSVGHYGHPTHFSQASDGLLWSAMQYAEGGNNYY